MLMIEDKLQKIKNILDMPENIGTSTNGDDSQVHSLYEEILEALGMNYDNANIKLGVGASKMALIPDDSTYVLKIPFNGSWSWIEDEDEDNEIEVFDIFEGAENNEDYWNYCEVELNRYNLAVEEEVSEFFATTKFFGYTKGKNSFPVYIQEKINPFKYTEGKTYSREEIRNTYNKFSSLGLYYDFDTVWVLDAIKYYGFEKVIKLFMFIEKNDIADLHIGNYGYALDGRPVILDFSNFNN